MNSSTECSSVSETSVSFPKHFLTSLSNDSTVSESFVEIDLTDTTADSTLNSPNKLEHHKEFMPFDKENNLSESNGRKRNLADVSEIENTEQNADAQCQARKSRRLGDSADSFAAADSGFSVFPIDNCFKNVQTPYCIVFPSISLASSSDSVTKDGEKQVLFSNIQNLSPTQGINDLKPSLRIPCTSASASKTASEELGVNSKNEYTDLGSINNNEEEDSSKSEEQVTPFSAAHTETFSSYENLPSQERSEMAARETAKQVIDAESVSASSSISTVNTDTLVKITPDNITEQLESNALSGRIVGPQVIYTTHPRAGQLVFAEDLGLQSPNILQPKYSLLSSTQNNLTFTPTVVKPQLLNLNSSGEETSPETSADATPVAQGSSQNERLVPHCLINSPKNRPSSAESSFDEIHGRESHNIKERKRRARIKEACDLMRFLVPGMTDKTDKATVFEFGARYIHFLKSYVGTSNDKDFLIKYSPYY